MKKEISFKSALLWTPISMWLMLGFALAAGTVYSDSSYNREDVAGISFLAGIGFTFAYRYVWVFGGALIDMALNKLTGENPE